MKAVIKGKRADTESKRIHLTKVTKAILEVWQEDLDDLLKNAKPPHEDGLSLLMGMLKYIRAGLSRKGISRDDIVRLRGFLQIRLQVINDPDIDPEARKIDEPQIRCVLNELEFYTSDVRMNLIEVPKDSLRQPKCPRCGHLFGSQNITRFTDNVIATNCPICSKLN